MPDYTKRNRVVIKNAFRRLEKSEASVIDNGLHNFLMDAMDQLVKEHEEFGAANPSFPDFHGEWDNETIAAGLANRDDVKDIWGQMMGQDVPYNVATDMLDALLSKASNAWVGVVLSGMVGGSAPYRAYREDYEIMFYEAVIDWARRNFMDYFKPVR